jgi:hypothetical protein
LSPCHSATFVKETAREALVFKLQLNCDTLAYVYYIENLGDPFAYIFKFSMWGYECIFWKLLNAIFPSDIPRADAVLTATMRKL